MTRWNTTIKGRKLITRRMTDAERKLYGPPLTGRAKLEAEIAAMWDTRTVEREAEEWELEATPNR